MKEKILNYFKTDRSYSGGVTLVMQYSRRLALKKQLNIQPQSDYIIGVIHEELRELAGMTQQNLKDILSVKVAAKKEAVPDPVVSEEPGEVKADPPAEKKEKKTGKAKSQGSKKVNRKK